MAERHYSPQARLELVDRGQGLSAASGTVAYVGFGALPVLPIGVRGVLLPLDAEAVGACLYALLHELDDAGFVRIVMERPPEGEAWMAVRDRLQRASTKETA
jgi:L-threonylcarbamoyladenylate synthase